SSHERTRESIATCCYFGKATYAIRPMVWDSENVQGRRDSRGYRLGDLPRESSSATTLAGSCSAAALSSAGAADRHRGNGDHAGPHRIGNSVEGLHDVRPQRRRRAGRDPSLLSDDGRCASLLSSIAAFRVLL